MRQRPESLPRLRLVFVALIALASLGALAASRPQLPGSVWSRGDDLALVIAWWVAVAASAWLFAATGACLLALGLTRPALARRLAGALPFGMRRLVDIAIVTSCVALPALPAVPALAAGRPPVAAVVVHDQPVVRAPQPPAITAPVPVPRSIAPSDPAPLPPAPSASRRVVRAGDNLWLIARTSLTEVRGHRPDDAEIARYWRAVIDANRATLRSGNPSLIFPGEIVALPPSAAVS